MRLRGVHPLLRLLLCLRGLLGCVVFPAGADRLLLCLLMWLLRWGLGARSCCGAGPGLRGRPLRGCPRLEV